MTKKLLPILIFLSVIVGFTFVAKTSKVYAASCSWNGSVDGNWSNPSNWDLGCSGTGGVPGNGDSITFPLGISTKNTNNDISSLTLNTINVNDATYTIGGNSFTLTNSIVVNTNSALNVDANIILGNNVTFSSNFSLWINGGLDLNGYNLELNSGDDIQIHGVISGNGDVSATNSGRLIMDSASTYTGGFFITGTLQVYIKNSNGIGNSANTLSRSGIGPIIIEGDNLNIPNNFNISATTSIYNLGNNNIISGNIGTSGQLYLLIQTGDLSITGILSGSGSIFKDFSNSLTLGGASSNTFTGTFTINDGSVTLSKTGNSIAISGNLSIGNSSGAAESTTLILSSANQVANGSSVTIQSDGYWNLDQNERIGSIAGNGRLTIATSKNLTIGENATSTTFSGVLDGAGGLEKIGSGSLTLSSDELGYTGLLSATEGLLIINGDFSNTPVNIDGGTLGGSGTIKSILSYDGSIAPGSSLGILNVNQTVSLSNLTTLKVDLNSSILGTGYDQLHATGNINLNNTSLEVNPGFTPTIGTAFTILKTDGVLSGTFGNLTNGSIFVGGQEFAVFYYADSIDLVKVATLYLTSFTNTPSTSTFGQSVTIYAHWTGSAGIPTGESEFFDGDRSLGIVTMVNGEASITIANLSIGTHEIKVTYSGDSTYNAAISGPKIQTVNAAPIIYYSSNNSSSNSSNSSTSSSTKITPVSYATSSSSSSSSVVPVSQDVSTEQRSGLVNFLIVGALIIFVILAVGIYYYKTNSD